MAFAARSSFVPNFSEDSFLQVLFLSGFYASAATLGQPDAGMLGHADMIPLTQRIREVVPGALLIVDGDTGYGGPVQVRIPPSQPEASVSRRDFALNSRHTPKLCLFLRVQLRCGSGEAGRPCAGAGGRSLRAHRGPGAR